MPTSTKPPVKTRAKSAVKKAQPAARARRPAKTQRKTPEPFLRFYHSEALRTKTLSVLDELESAEDSTRHRNALAGIVAELTDSGMDYYFMRPLKLAKTGFLTEQSANLGMTGATSVLGSVIRNIIGRMDHAQLRTVSGYLRDLME